MEQNLAALREQGLGLAALSYDSPAVLKNFAGRRGITYPLLSDADSAVIRSFGVLNESVPKDSGFYGIPYPVTFVVDPTGVVKSRYVEDDYRQRYTTAGLLAREFGVLPRAAAADTRAKHVELHTAASASVARSGQRITLMVEARLRPGMHVYAPGQHEYIPVEWKLKESPAITPHPVSYPAGKVVRLEAIGESVAVYEGVLRLMGDVTIAKAPPGELTIEGTFRYQACDERECFPPETVPLRWTLRIEAHDTERPPADLQRKLR